MPAYTLIYWPGFPGYFQSPQSPSRELILLATGRGEFVRLAFEAASVAYTDLTDPAQVAKYIHPDYAPEKGKGLAPLAPPILK